MNLSQLLSLVRPRQWPKNVFVLGGLVFGGRLLEPDVVLDAFLATVLFTALSGAVYIFNDLKDASVDKLHPAKKDRPLAAGTVSPAVAITLGAILLTGSMAGAFWLGTGFAAILLGYATINVFYSIWWKHVPILDILCVASGFVLRVVAGILAVNVPMRPWIVVCTLGLALLMSLGKRRAEVILLGEEASAHRKILEHYPLQFLDILIVIAATLTLVAYSLFTFDSGHGQLMMLTTPFVIYGVLRYLYLLYVVGTSDPPEVLVLRDNGLLIGVLLWALTTTALFYYDMNHSVGA